MKDAAATGHKGEFAGNSGSRGGTDMSCHVYALTSVDQIAENKELARACEDLRSGVGNLSPMTLSPREIPP